MLAVGALGGVAVATGDAGLGDDLTEPGSIRVDERSLPDGDAAEHEALAKLAKVDEAAAGAAATKSVGGGEVILAHLEEEGGFVVWEARVKAADGSVHEVLVDAGNGRVLGSEREDDDAAEGDDLSAPGTIAVDEAAVPDGNDAEHQALAGLATVKKAAAEAAAARAVPGGRVVESELEAEEGFVVWDALVRAGDGALSEVAVDAGSGTVLSVSGDDDAADDDVDDEDNDEDVDDGDEQEDVDEGAEYDGKDTD